MSRRIDLPKGQWAELRDPEDVPERLRRPVMKAFRRRAGMAERVSADDIEAVQGEDKQKQAEAALRAAMSITDEDLDGIGEYQVAVMLALVREWSYGPVTEEAVLDLPGRAYDLLRQACDPLINDMFLDVTPDPNPAAPSGGSNGSATPSTEALSTTPLSTGEPVSS